MALAFDYISIQMKRKDICDDFKLEEYLCSLGLIQIFERFIS